MQHESDALGIPRNSTNRCYVCMKKPASRLASCLDQMVHTNIHRLQLLLRVLFGLYLAGSADAELSFLNAGTGLPSF
jgi:hypothetical protein